MKGLWEFIREGEEIDGIPFYESNNGEVVLLDTMDDEDDAAVDYFFDEVGIEDKEHNNGYLITGDLGRWNGKKEIYPEYEDYLDDAVKRVIEKVEKVKITLIDGRINIIGAHHDGQNDMWISALSKKGQEKFENWESGDADDDLSFLKDHSTFEAITFGNKDMKLK